MIESTRAKPSSTPGSREEDDVPLSTSDGHIVVEGATPDCLQAIELSVCALAVWHRRLDDRIALELCRLHPSGLDDLDIELLGDDRRVLGLDLEAAGYPPGISHEFAVDMTSLAEIYSTAGPCVGIRLRLEWIETDACRRFHVDMVTTRLLCTYVGPGTQWKLASWDDQRAVGLRAGDVAILKGRQLAPHRPVLHRSPPIVATGERRLLLTLDAMDRYC